MFTMITDKPVPMRKEFSNEAQDLISNLLDWNPKTWLGGGARDAKEVKEHPFFASIDWDALYNKEMQAPFVPSVRSEDDAS